MKRAPEVVAAGEVVSVRPALLDEKAGAAYCGTSAATFRAMRAADVKAREAYQPITGPEWIVLRGSMIRYRLSALDAWIERASVPFGTVESKRRTPAEAPAQETT